MWFDVDLCIGYTNSTRSYVDYNTNAFMYRMAKRLIQRSINNENTTTEHVMSKSVQNDIDE